MELIGNIWMELTEGDYTAHLVNILDKIYSDEQAKRELPQGLNIKYYLTTWNNTAMIQTGNSNGESTEDERKVLANTLFYLKQLTKKTEVLDNSARDIADPNKVNNVNLIMNKDGTSTIKFNRPEDNRKYI